jgi:hypothetical protein
MSNFAAVKNEAKRVATARWAGAIDNTGHVCEGMQAEECVVGAQENGNHNIITRARNSGICAKSE